MEDLQVARNTEHSLKLKRAEAGGMSLNILSRSEGDVTYVTIHCCRERD